jgi:hypothetical protein
VKIVVLHSINFSPPTEESLTVEVARQVQASALTIAVYQNEAGETQAAIVKGAYSPDEEIMVFDVV